MVIVGKNLIEVDPQYEDLRQIQKEKFEEALRNIITGTTPKEVVYQRPARGGLQVDYVPGWWFIAQLNALFGYYWDLEVVDKEIEWKIKQVWVLVKLTVKGPDGVSVSKTSFGSSDIKYYSQQPDKPLDIADDLKSAVTDGMKKAATMLGMAADIYGERERLEKTGATKSHLNALYAIGVKVGMDKDAVDEYCKKKYEKTPNELETVVVLGLVQELRNKPVVGKTSESS